MTHSPGSSPEPVLDGHAEVVVLHAAGAVSTAQAADACSALSRVGFRARGQMLSSAGLLAAVEELSRSKSELALVNLCGARDADVGGSCLLAALLSFHQLRFAGNTSETLTCAVDKRITKAILYAAGIPTPGARVFRRRPPQDTVSDMSFPLIIKALRSTPALPLSIDSFVSSPEELCRRLQEVIEGHGLAALAEVYMEGREFGVAVTGEGKQARAIAVTELIFGSAEPEAPRLFAEGVPMERQCPASVGEHLRVAIATAAVAAYRALECRDYAWIALRLDRRGEPHVLEVDAAPELSLSSPFAAAIRASGDTYEDFLARLVGRVWAR